MPEINGISLPFMPAGGVGELKKSSQNVNNGRNVSFDELLSKELDKLKFSAHAQSRLASREISLGDEDISRLKSAVDIAGEKGSNESLILLDEKAFIVSVPNKTVITVVNKDPQSGSVITNIDSAVIA